MSEQHQHDDHESKVRPQRPARRRITGCVTCGCESSQVTGRTRPENRTGRNPDGVSHERKCCRCRRSWWERGPVPIALTDGGRS